MDACNLKTFRGGTTFVGINALRAGSFSPLQFATVARSLSKPAKKLALASSAAKRATNSSARPGALTQIADVHNVRLDIRACGATAHVQNVEVAFSGSVQKVQSKAGPHITSGHRRVLKSAFNLAFFSLKFKKDNLQIEGGIKAVSQSFFDLVFFSAGFKLKEAAPPLESLEHRAERSSPEIGPLFDDDLTVVADSDVPDASQHMDGGRDEFAQPAVYSLISCNSPEHHDTALDLDCHAVEQLDCVLKEVSKLSDYSPKGRCQEQLKALHDYTPSEESHFELQHNFHLLEDIAEEVELNKEYWQEQQASHVYGVEDPEDELHFLQDIPLTAFDKRIQSIEERYWPARTPSNEVIPPDLSRNARRRRIRKQKKTQRSTGPNDVAVTIEQPSNSSRFLSSNDSQDDAKKPRRQRTRKKKTKNQNA